MNMNGDSASTTPRVNMDITYGSGDPLLGEKIREYLEWDKNPYTHGDIVDLVLNKNFTKLRKLLHSRLEFGTAGIRGRMGAGFAQMNDLVIVQTSQGLATYLYSLHGTGVQRPVIVGYDGRYNSRRFASLTAQALYTKGFQVCLFPECVPTPYVPYAVSLIKAVCGIMITASHNPKEDNGYKVYWENGAQIISPHDKKIQESILQNLKPWKDAWEYGALESSDPLELVEAGYKLMVEKDSLENIYMGIEFDSDLEFVYTPMHGVGSKFIDKAFKACNLKLPIHVPEQDEIDPDFPTVKFPNPEEGKSALKLAMQLADKMMANKRNASIILANDPDADRLAVAEREGQWKVFTGNELGTLLGWWAFHIYKYRLFTDPKDLPPIENCYMMASTVSSKFLKTMAKKEGFHFIETLTGFKWMGNETVKILESNRNSRVLFAFEEAIGFMFGTGVLDKDGINAGVRLAELARYLDTEYGTTLQGHLKFIWREYGYHVSENSYYICHSPETINKIFEELRTGPAGEEFTYPKSLMNGKYPIKSVRDLTAGYDSSQPDKKPILPVSKSSQMITFEFETPSNSTVVATLRTSGTEPKIKYYSELISEPSQSALLEDWAKLNKMLHEIVEALVSEFLQPTKYGLEARSD